MDGFDADFNADFDGWSFQRFEKDGKRRLIRDANESLLRSLELC